MQVSSSISSSEAVKEPQVPSKARNGVWRLVRNGMILVLVVIAMDQLVGRGLSYLYFKQKTGPNAETTFTFTKMNQDAFILGSSRGRRNYNPQPIADSLGISCYNAGHDGQTIFYEQAIVRMALARYSPKLVILDLNPEEMYYKDVHYDRLNVLAPYYAKYPEVRQIYLLKGVRDGIDHGLIVTPANTSTSSWDNFWFKHDAIEKWVLPLNVERFKMLSLIYRNNSSLLDILTGMYKNRKSESGFKPLKGVITQQKADELIRENAELRDAKGKVVDPNKIKGLEEILSTVTAHGGKVYVSMSPALAPFGMEPSYQAVLDICKKYNVAFKDYSQDTAYAHIQLFYDNHMNKDGANLFSDQLAHDLKVQFPELVAKQNVAASSKINP